jgi:hypothetical protein
VGALEKTPVRRFCFKAGAPIEGTFRISVGASVLEKPPTDDDERFLSMLRFDSKRKIEDLGIDKDIFTSLKRK